MATLKSGRKVSPKREARRALENAKTRAEAKTETDPLQAYATLLRGVATAQSWLDGTHPKLAEGTQPEPAEGSVLSLRQRVRSLRAAAGIAGYRLHYDGQNYSLLGEENYYGMGLSEAEAKVRALVA
jgi:hypothetical protein